MRLPINFWLIATVCLFFIGSLYSTIDHGAKTPQYKELLSLRAHMPVAKLKSLQVIFRHGSRTPIESYADGPLLYYPKVQWDGCLEDYLGITLNVVDSKTGADLPYEDKVVPLPGGICRRGQLTKVGFEQALVVGRWLRARYVEELGFLPETNTLQASLLSARTTRWSRTYLTLKGVLTGLAGRNRNSSITAVAEADSRDEVMYGSNATCAALGPLFQRLDERLDWQSDQRAQKRLKQQVSKALGVLNKPPVAWTHLYDEVAAMRALNMSVKGLSPKIWDILREQAIKYEVDAVAPPLPCQVDPPDTCKSVLQLSMGRLVDLVLSNLDACANTRKGASCDKLLHLYSGHDTTLIPLLEVLKQDVEEWPPFASHVVVELWQFTSHRKVTSHYVRILYNGNELQLRNSRSLGTYLPVDDFRQRLKTFRLTKAEHDERCNTQQSD